MKEIVEVTTFKRPELLWLCLEAIRREDQKIPIHVSSDREDSSPELIKSCEEFHVGLSRHYARGYGNSSNVIDVLRHGVTFVPNGIVNLIEDDTIIHRGYFEQIRRALSSGKFAVALGRVPADITSTWYTSPAVSWDSQSLERCLELIPLGYYAETREEMQKVIDHAFPHSKYRFGSAEQDGAFLRCLEFLKLKSWYPEHDLASHLGFFGYQTDWSRQPKGTFEERISYCQKLLYDKARRTELFGQAVTEREMRGLNA